MPRAVHRLAGPLLAAIGLSLALAACNAEKRAEAPPPPRPVLVEPVSYQPRIAARSYVGTIRPRIESDLAFRVGGKIARRLAEVGDTVSAGQTLALLDETDLQLQREQAQAEAGAARAALTNAEAELKRVTTLRAEGWSAVAVLDRAKAATEEARGRLTRAERAATLAANALSYATLTSDAAGVVTAIMIEPGQVVAAGQAAIRLARMDEKEVVVAIPEAQLGFAREATASASLWSEPGRDYSARLREVAPSADAATRTYLARFALPDAGNRAALGMTATLTLTDPAAGKVARLPLTAILNQGEGASVFVVAKGGGKPEPRRVTIAGYEGREVLITDGVTDGELVVTMGVQKLDTGQSVRVVDALSF